MLTVIKVNLETRATCINNAFEMADENDVDEIDYYRASSDMEKSRELIKLGQLHPVLSSIPEYQNLSNKLHSLNTDIKAANEDLKKRFKSYIKKTSSFPTNLIARYLEMDPKSVKNATIELPNTADNKNKSDKDKERLNKKIISAIVFAFAIIFIYYCLFGKDDNVFFGFIGVGILLIGAIATFFLKHITRVPMVIFSLFAAFLCAFGVYTSHLVKEPVRRSRAKEQARIEETRQKQLSFQNPDIYIGDMFTAETAIKAVNDVSNETLDKLNKYARFDLDSGFKASSYNSLRNKMDYLLEIASVQVPNTTKFSSEFNGERVFKKKNATLHSISLFAPKQPNALGKIKLNYYLDIRFLWKDDAGNKNWLITPVFVSYVWQIDLNNKDKPVSDYSKYTFDYTNCDVNYDNWYYKNISSEKDKYEISERILK